MKRGEIYWVDLDPTRGGEIGKRRPSVIVSNDSAIRAQNRVQIIPVTSNVTRLFPWEAPLTVQGRPGKALADQIRTVPTERLIDLIGHVTAAELRAIERALKVQLGLV